jgi:hypothetical protein
VKRIKSDIGKSYNLLLSVIDCECLKCVVVVADLNTPILVPIEADEFWQQIRFIIREELLTIVSQNVNQQKETIRNKETNGFQYKPLYDMKELRQLFSNVSRTTIYEWVKCGKLKPKKMKGKIYFLWVDIEKLLKEI